MRRTPRLTARFIDRRRALGADQGPTALAVARAIGALTRDELPGPADAETLVPPIRSYWFRRVPKQNLWLCFAFDDATVTVLNLTSRPPIPVVD